MQKGEEKNDGMLFYPHFYQYNVRYILVVRVFLQVRVRGLESTTVHWFVLASTLNLSISLPHVLREGTQVFTGKRCYNL